MSFMATNTTTIRVPIPTRDRLAAQARQRGISIAALLEELSDQAERQAAFEAERMATLADAEMPEVQDEDRDWDATAGDGIE
jgi:post-segregation antitoxin (ccd killing protein)